MSRMTDMVETPLFNCDWTTIRGNWVASDCIHTWWITVFVYTHPTTKLEIENFVLMFWTYKIHVCFCFHIQGLTETLLKIDSLTL